MAKSAHTALEPGTQVPAGAPVCLLAKVGEASLKGRNKRHFLDALRRSTRAALRGLDARVEGGGSVFVIPVPDELTAAEAASRLERVFGFVTGSVCLRCDRDPEQIVLEHEARPAGHLPRRDAAASHPRGSIRGCTSSRSGRSRP